MFLLRTAADKLSDLWGSVQRQPVLQTALSQSPPVAAQEIAAVTASVLSQSNQSIRNPSSASLAPRVTSTQASTVEGKEETKSDIRQDVSIAPQQLPLVDQVKIHSQTLDKVKFDLKNKERKFFAGMYGYNYPETTGIASAEDKQFEKVRLALMLLIEVLPSLLPDDVLNVLNLIYQSVNFSEILGKTYRTTFIQKVNNIFGECVEDRKNHSSMSWGDQQKFPPESIFKQKLVEFFQTLQDFGTEKKLYEFPPRLNEMDKFKIAIEICTILILESPKIKTGSKETYKLINNFLHTFVNPERLCQYHSLKEKIYSIGSKLHFSNLFETNTPTPSKLLEDIDRILNPGQKKSQDVLALDFDDYDDFKGRKTKLAPPERGDVKSNLIGGAKATQAITADSVSGLGLLPMRTESRSTSQKDEVKAGGAAQASSIALASSFRGGLEIELNADGYLDNIVERKDSSSTLPAHRIPDVITIYDVYERMLIALYLLQNEHLHEHPCPKEVLAVLLELFDNDGYSDVLIFTNREDFLKMLQSSHMKLNENPKQSLEDIQGAIKAVISALIHSTSFSSLTDAEKFTTFLQATCHFLLNVTPSQATVNLVVELIRSNKDASSFKDKLFDLLNIEITKILKDMKNDINSKNESLKRNPKDEFWQSAVIEQPKIWARILADEIQLQTENYNDEHSYKHSHPCVESPDKFLLPSVTKGNAVISVREVPKSLSNSPLWIKLCNGNQTLMFRSTSIVTNENPSLRYNRKDARKPTTEELLFEKVVFRSSSYFGKFRPGVSGGFESLNTIKVLGCKFKYLPTKKGVVPLNYMESMLKVYANQKGFTFVMISCYDSFGEPIKDINLEELQKKFPNMVIKFEPAEQSLRQQKIELKNICKEKKTAKAKADGAAKSVDVPKAEGKRQQLASPKKEVPVKSDDDDDIILRSSF